MSAMIFFILVADLTSFDLSQIMLCFSHFLAQRYIYTTYYQQIPWKEPLPPPYGRICPYRQTLFWYFEPSEPPQDRVSQQAPLLPGVFTVQQTSQLNNSKCAPWDVENLHNFDKITTTQFGYRPPLPSTKHGVVPFHTFHRGAPSVY